MPFKINGFSIGQDLDLSIRDSRGNIINWFQMGHGMEFDANRDDVELKVTPITSGGKPLFDTLPAGWSGRIVFTRVDGSVSNLFAALDQNFYALGRREFFTFFVSILNRDGSTDQYQFTRVSMSRASFGNFRADKEVDQTITWRAQELISNSGLLPPIVGFGP